VAIVDDIKRDRRTKNVLAQTNTKTVSAPAASTGLIGDQAPAEIFTATDFDLVKNQVHLEEENFQLMEALNTIGQITNMQSQSGPIPGTMAIKTSTSTGSGTLHTIFQPDAGQVWQLIDASFDLNNPTGSVNLRLYLSDGTNSVVIDHEAESASGEFTTASIGPILFSNTVYLQGWQQGTFDGVTWKAAVVRVR